MQTRQDAFNERQLAPDTITRPYAHLLRPVEYLSSLDLSSSAPVLLHDKVAN